MFLVIIRLKMFKVYGFNEFHVTKVRSCSIIHSCQDHDGLCNHCLSRFHQDGTSSRAARKTDPSGLSASTLDGSSRLISLSKHSKSRSPFPEKWSNICTSRFWHQLCNYYLVVDLTHGTGAKLTTLLWARRKTESHIIAKSHSTKSKSSWARLIHHIQWHHQILTKQCAHCGHADFKYITSHSKLSKIIKNMRKPCGHAGCHEIW